MRGRSYFGAFAGSLRRAGCSDCRTLLSVLRVLGEKLSDIDWLLCVRRVHWMLTAVGTLLFIEADRPKSENLAFNPSSQLASPNGIHRVLMSSDREWRKICYQNGSSLGLGFPLRRLGSLASDQEGHVFDSVWFRLVWRLYLVSRT